MQIRHESVFAKSWLSEAKKSPKCLPMGAKMDQKVTKKAPKTHPKNNFEKRYPKNVLWESFGAVLGSPWVALCTSDRNPTGGSREEGVPGKSPPLRRAKPLPPAGLRRWRPFSTLWRHFTPLRFTSPHIATFRDTSSHFRFTSSHFRFTSLLSPSQFSI